jgi:hypothetical protein
MMSAPPAPVSDIGAVSDLVESLDSSGPGSVDPGGAGDGQ